jgi:hypothetical protein
MNQLQPITKYVLTACFFCAIAFYSCEDKFEHFTPESFRNQYFPLEVGE